MEVEEPRKLQKTAGAKKQNWSKESTQLENSGEREGLNFFPCSEVGLLVCVLQEL